MAAEVSFFLAAIAWLPRVVLTSLVTFLCLWQAKRTFTFLRGLYMARHLPHVYQYLDIFSRVGFIFPSLLKYKPNFYEAAPGLFASMHTPLFAFISSKSVTVHINDAHLIREVSISKRRSFPKAVHMYDRLRVFGENIVTTEGETWRRHRFVAQSAFSEANNRLVFETVKECVGGMMDAWERQREEGQKKGGKKEGFRVTLMEDITQLTLAIITQATFGLQLEAAYGKEREEKEKAEKEGGREGGKEGGDSRYTMSFTKCMETVSHSTLAKVLIPGWLFRVPIFPKLEEIERAYTEFNSHLMDSVEQERGRQGGREGGVVMKKEDEEQEKVELGGLRGRRGVGLIPFFLKRKDKGGKEGGATKKEEGEKEETVASVRSPEEKEQERQHTQRRQQNLFSLLVQANDNADDSTATSTGEGEREGGMEGKRGKDDRLELQELLGNAFIFLLAGHETSAHTLVWALLLLALHPDEQAAAHEEVLRVLGPPSLPSSPSSSSSPSSMTYDQLSILPHCQGVMNEALRLFPPVVTIPKLCTAETTLTVPPSSSLPASSSSSSSFRIPKGANVFLQIYALHRNPKHYVEPNAFKPRRWKARGKEGGKEGGNVGGKEGEEQRVDIDYFAFVPFSLGERSCLGRKFGQITVIATLALLLQRYEIGVVEGREGGREGEGWEERKARMLQTENVVTLCPKDFGIQLVFTKRR